VAFIPFPTRVLAEFVRTDDGRAAALLYGVTMLAMSVTFLSVWLYASRGGRLLRPDADPRAISGITRSFLPGLPMYAAATLVAFVSPEASAALFGLLALFYVVSSSVLGRRRP
jgi:TMEM175 potassium channel family protein